MPFYLNSKIYRYFFVVGNDLVHSTVAADAKNNTVHYFSVNVVLFHRHHRQRGLYV